MSNLVVIEPNAINEKEFISNERILSMWLFGKSQSSQEAYSRVATKMLEFIGKPLRNITLEDLQSWLTSLECGQNTTKTYVAITKSLFSFATKIGAIQFNPMVVIKSPKERECLNERILSPDEVRQLIEAATNPRDRLMLRMLYYCGLRVSELISLKWKDLSYDGRLKVLGKGGKARTIKLRDDLVGELRTLEQEGEFIFISRKGGGRLRRQSVHRILKAIAIDAGINPNVSPHWLRHCNASHALKNGANLDVICKSLGHSSIAITGKYLHSDPDESTGHYL